MSAIWRKADIGLWLTSGLIETVIRLSQYALGNGVTKDELAEVITTWVFDAGWICASMATGSARLNDPALISAGTVELNTSARAASLQFDQSHACP